MLNEHGITIARFTYYKHAGWNFGPTAAELEDAYAAHEVHRQWTVNRRLYGQHKLVEDNGPRRCVARVQRSREQVARLMRIPGPWRGPRERSTITTSPGLRPGNLPDWRELVGRPIR